MNVFKDLMEQISKQFGWEIGNKIRVEIEKYVQLNNVDVEELQKTVDTIKKILDADPDTEEFDVAQNIIKQIKNILSDIDKLKSDIKDLTARTDKSEKDISELKKQLEQVNKDIADAKEYMDSTFVKRSDILEVNVEELRQLFVKAMDCGFEQKDMDSEDCSDNTDNTNNTNNTDNTDNTDNTGNTNDTDDADNTDNTNDADNTGNTNDADDADDDEVGDGAVL